MNSYTIRCKPRRRIVKRRIRGQWMWETLECGHEVQRGVGTGGKSCNNAMATRRVCWECNGKEPHVECGRSCVKSDNAYSHLECTCQ